MLSVTDLSLSKKMNAAHITMSWCTFYVCLDAYLCAQSVMEISSNERLRLQSVNYSPNFPALPSDYRANQSHQLTFLYTDWFLIQTPPLTISIKAPPLHTRQRSTMGCLCCCLFLNHQNFFHLILRIWSAAVSVLDSGLVGPRVVMRTVEFITLLCVMWPFCLTCFPGLIKEHN